MMLKDHIPKSEFTSVGVLAEIEGAGRVGRRFWRLAVLGAGCWVLGAGCWVLGAAGCWVPPSKIA